MKKAWLLAAGFLIIAALPGCGEVPSRPASVSTVPAAAKAGETAQEASMTIYLADDDGMKLTAHTLSVPAKDKSLKTALDRMILLDREQTYRVLPDGLSVRAVNVSNGTAFIDLSKELEHLGGGNTTHGLFIAMFVNTATEFPNVKEVLFRMEGEPITFLTGHYDMTAPFRRDETFILMEKK